MFTLPGYKIIEKIYQGRNSSIYRGMSLEENQRRVIIKVPNTKLPNTKGADKLRREFEYCQKIQSQYVIKSIALVAHYTHGNVLVIEDDQAIKLNDQIPATGFDTLTFLKLAIQLTQGLNDIHHNNVVHHDLKPNNMIINPQSGDVKIIDFGSASPLHESQLLLISPDITEGTLAYISPEQTARINRRLDYRTDFYSLGVTFYQMITGKLPFKVTTIQELVYCHIAKQPIIPSEIKPSIPQVISSIIMRLMRKAAEERYQSAWGILDDLKNCLVQYQKTGEIKPFALAKQDRVEGFFLSQKLYGRETEISHLQNAYAQTCKGTASVVMVTGHAGTGKSVLVNEMRPHIVAKRSHFLSGKFEQLNRGTAYSAITQAFSSWAKQVLTSSEEEILNWKFRLLDALSGNAQVIIDVIPDLESIIGKQPIPPLLGIDQARNRFHLVFQKFINLFAQEKSPLFLFLDDLQWADLASLNLIEALMINPESCYSLFIGAYRDNEVDSSHPLINTLKTLQKSNISMQFIELHSLKLVDVNLWLADTLNLPPENTISLSELIYQKTAGNPFFVKSFLYAIYEEKFLTIMSEQGWQWDLDKIRQHKAMDNVIDLMIDQIKQLPLDAQEILKLASCLRFQISWETLQIITRYSEKELRTLLATCLEKGLVVQVDNNLRFAHDRVQEAINQLIPKNECQKIALLLGRLLQSKLPLIPSPNQLFEVVEHLNIAKNLITDRDEQTALAKLNFQAAKHAKHAIAYASALRYLKEAEVHFMTTKFWEENYDIAFELYKELADVAYLNLNIDAATEYIDSLLGNARTELEKAEIYNQLVIQKTLAAEYQEAIDIGNKALRLLRIQLPTENLSHALQDKIVKVKVLLQQKKIEKINTLLDAPEMKNPEIKAAIKLLHNLLAPTYLANQPLYAVITLIMVELSLNYGNAVDSAMAYGSYAMLLSAQLGEIQLGSEFGLLAIELSNRFHHLPLLCKTHFIYANFIHHWVKPLLQVDSHVKKSLAAGLESGEFQFLGYLSQFQATYFFYTGTSLVDIYTELSKLLSLTYNCKNQLVMDSIHAVQLIVSNLSGQSKNISIFAEGNHSEEEYQAVWLQNKSFYALANYLILKAKVLYLYGDYEKSLQLIVQAKKYISYIPGHFSVAVHNYYYSLCLLALYPAVDNDTKSEYLKQIEINQTQMKIWVDHCPENFMSRDKLISAELCRVKDEPANAMKLYEDALTPLPYDEFFQEIAITNELAAKFWLSQGMLSCAQGPMLIAYQSYGQWGAIHKASALMKQHSTLLMPFAIGLSSLHVSGEATISAKSLRSLDLASVLKASQTISKEIELSKLLLNIMKVVVENAGAQKGAFFIEEGDMLWLQAEYTAEGQIQTFQKIPLMDWRNGSHAIIDEVRKTKQTILLGNAYKDERFVQDIYISQHQIYSVLCAPVIKQDQLVAIIYLENNLAPYVFTHQHLLILTILAGQMATSLGNSRLVQSELAVKQQFADEQRRRADDAEKNQREKESFMDVICHEIRNPISGITGSLGFIEQDIADLKKLGQRDQQVKNLEEQAQTIRECVAHQKEIINNALDVSKFEAGKIVLEVKPFQPKKLIETVVNIFSAQLRSKGLNLILQLPEKIPVVKGDEERLKIVLINLISNAIKYTDKGNIKVSLEIQDFTATQSTLKISVEDMGIGMTEEECAQLFKRFSCPVASSQYKGTGLGLVIVKDTLALMNGEVQVESTKGVGSKFTITITLFTAFPEEITNPSPVSTKTPQKVAIPKMILVVEDNIVNQKIMCKQLDDVGHRCIVANNGKEAIELWKMNKIDLIFMDLQMPVMDGMTATKIIRKQEKDLGKGSVPIIGLSAYARAEYKYNAVNAGMNDYLTKPYEKEKIYSAVEHFTQQPLVTFVEKQNKNEITTQTSKNSEAPRATSEFWQPIRKQEQESSSDKPSSSPTVRH